MSRNAESRPSMVDPETVAKVSRATARTAYTIVTVTTVVARFVAKHTVASARWLGPRAWSLVVALARGSWRGLGAAAEWTRAHQRGVTGVGHRMMWWGALAILVLVGRALLSADGDPELVDSALLWFGSGLALSVVVLLSAPERRMRVAAVALAGGHGSLAALVLVVTGS